MRLPFPLPSVLLVDDDSTTNFLHKALLIRLGVAARVDVVLSGQQALDYVQAHCGASEPNCPALILLDVNMPGMNGIEFLAAYQRLPPVAAPPVVVMLTTSLHPRDLEQVQRLPVQGFFNKPLNKDKIAELLRTHFRHELPAS